MGWQGLGTIGLHAFGYSILRDLECRMIVPAGEGLCDRDVAPIACVMYIAGYLDAITLDVYPAQALVQRSYTATL